MNVENLDSEINGSALVRILRKFNMRDRRTRARAAGATSLRITIWGTNFIGAGLIPQTYSFGAVLPTPLNRLRRHRPPKQDLALDRLELSRRGAGARNRLRLGGLAERVLGRGPAISRA